MIPALEEVLADDDYERLPLPVRMLVTRREYECSPDQVKQEVVTDACTPDSFVD